MTKDFGQANPDVVSYVWSLLEPEDEVLQAARMESERRGLPVIQVGAMDGRHLEILLRAASATKVVEIGTLGGYSGISLCRGMGPHGRLFTFEYDPHHAEVARANFKAAKVVDQVEIHVGPALENLPHISAQAPFDAVFIDADKVNYPKYLEWATAHLRMGGMVIGDNTFAWEKIHLTHGLAPDLQRQVDALRSFNETLARSGRYRTTILPTGMGLTVGVKIA